MKEIKALPMSFRERFIGLPNPAGPSGGLYAPSTIGAPQYTHGVNYTEFKKSKEEKDLLKEIKIQHKKDLLKCYGKSNTNRKMNPSQSNI